MTIGPTVAGGLKIVPETEHDWMLLLGIAGDADSDLAKRLAGLMDEDSMWDEIVVPELEDEFSKQRTKVVREVIKAKENEEDVHILAENAETWYGALNQARLALEAEHKLGARKIDDPSEIQSVSARSAYFRNDFYCTVQSLLLRYVFEDS